MRGLIEWIAMLIASSIIKRYDGCCDEGLADLLCTRLHVVMTRAQAGKSAQGRERITTMIDRDLVIDNVCRVSLAKCPAHFTSGLRL